MLDYFFRNIVKSSVTLFLKNRVKAVEYVKNKPLEAQQETFLYLINKGKHTIFGQKHAYKHIKNVHDYQKNVPICTYEAYFPWIQKIIKGEQNVLWPSKVTWFSKSSGTTNERSKFIPITKESLHHCHYIGGKDMLALYNHLYPKSNALLGKGLSIGGSCVENDPNIEYPNFHGDISAVITRHLPFWAEYMRTPKPKIALMEDWEAKLNAMLETTVPENVTSLLGVPTWILVFLERILEKTGKKDIRDIWPNLELFVHGAVSFTPYRQAFESYIPHADMKYLETYTASEGFFALQDLKYDDPDYRQDMLLMLNYGVYYEFIPKQESDSENPTVLTIEDVKLNQEYEMVITTNGGLWRYRIGDTVKFTCLAPYRIRISGRTKHFINVFGEEVVVENTDKALEVACRKTKASISDYLVAPIFLEKNKKGGHEWVVSFYQEPNDWSLFCEIIDHTLRAINSDYDAKRSYDIALVAPTIQKVERSVFMAWMEKKNKLGGQNKVPRLSNERHYLEDLLSYKSK